MTHLSFRLICFFLLTTHAVLILAQPNVDQATQTVSVLEQGKPVERELRGRESHAYTLEPKAGQFVSVVVEQRTVGIEALLFAPEGHLLAAVHSQSVSKGSAEISFVANGSGKYRIDVRPLEKTTTGRYQIRIDAIRAATSKEKDRDKVRSLATALVYAESEVAGAAMLANNKEFVTVELVRELDEHVRRLRDQSKLPLALVVSRFILQLAERIGDKIGVSDAIHNIGDILFRQRNFSQALEHLQRSLNLYEEVGDKAKLADTIWKIAYCYQQQDNLQQALDHFQRSLALDGEIGGGKTADLLFSIGAIHWRSGRGTEAIEAFQKSLIQYQETGNKIQEYNVLGYIHYLQGNFSSSLENTRKTLDLAYELGDKTKIGWTLSQMSTTSRVLGDFTNSMEYIEKALSISETVDNKDLRMNILITSGLLHQRLENRMKALEFYKKALILAEELKNNTLTANALEKIGSILFLEGKFAQAMENFQKCLTLNEAIGNNAQAVYTLNWIGSVYHQQGNYAQALEYFDKALKLSEKNGNKLQIIVAVISIASLHVENGDFAQALEFCERAVALSKQVGELENLPRALYWLGRAYHGLKRFEESLRAFEGAIFIIESTRSNIAGLESRTTFFATHWGSYEAYVDLRMQLHSGQPMQGHDVQAFQMNQRARARSLLELLNESRTQIDQGVAPELLARERALQKELNERADQQMRLLNGKHTADQAELLKKEIESLSFEYRKNQAQIRLKSPRYAALTQPQPLTANEIQRDLLDANTVLLEYALGGERSYLWVVTSTSLQSYELPNRSEIENDVRRVIALLNDGKRWASDEKISTEFTQVAAALSRKLLPASVLSQLKGKRLAIVSDGVLQYLPFGALPLLTENNSKIKEPSTVGVPLSADFEIVNLPSASALAVQRSELPNRKQPTKSIAIFADPIFSETDERVPAIKADQSRVSRPWKTDPNRVLLERAFNLGGKPGELFSIPRLPFTRSEANSIFALAPKNKAIRALDFDADREKLLKTDLSKYRIIHFATHGILHSEHPELSGIVLSLVNEKGEPVNGFLRLNEIYNMNLNADLVVLSACQTALGKEVRGEGLIGLTRGFMYAGSPRVVASLWKVDDVATAELMKIFYQKMLKEKMRPAAALRAAKIAMMKQKRWAAPYYWAAFELQGEWR
jgi:CHAT domain-containing protein/Tfp pilus assembly protein PilF